MSSSKVNATREVAVELINHGLWIAIAFVALIVIAGGVEWADKGLIIIHVFEEGGILDYASKAAAGIIALGDIVLVLIAGYILRDTF
jgi:hypothetical protein